MQLPPCHNRLTSSRKTHKLWHDEAGPLKAGKLAMQGEAGLPTAQVLGGPQLAPFLDREHGDGQAGQGVGPPPA